MPPFFSFEMILVISPWFVSSTTYCLFLLKVALYCPLRTMVLVSALVMALSVFLLPSRRSNCESRVYRFRPLLLVLVDADVRGRPGPPWLVRLLVVVVVVVMSAPSLRFAFLITFSVFLLNLFLKWVQCIGALSCVVWFGIRGPLTLSSGRFV